MLLTSSPEIARAHIVLREARVPRMTGFPTMIFASTVMRSSNSSSFIGNPQGKGQISGPPPPFPILRLVGNNEDLSNPEAAPHLEKFLAIMNDFRRSLRAIGFVFAFS